MLCSAAIGAHRTCACNPGVGRQSQMDNSAYSMAAEYGGRRTGSASGPRVGRSGPVSLSNRRRRTTGLLLSRSQKAINWRHDCVRVPDIASREQQQSTPLRDGGSTSSSEAPDPVALSSLCVIHYSLTGNDRYGRSESIIGSCEYGCRSRC